VKSSEPIYHQQASDLLSTIGKLRVRLGALRDIDWCVTEDKNVDREILRRKIESNEILIAELGDQIVGYLRLEYLWSRMPYISMINVQKELRGQGIGRSILKFLEDYLRKKGHKSLMSWSQVNEEAPQRWHRSVGFKECGIIAGLNEGGIGEVFFRKLLD